MLKRCVGLLGFVACAISVLTPLNASVTENPGRNAEAPADTSLFSAVLASLSPSEGRTIRVDPRPATANPTFSYPSIEALAPVADEVLRGRREALRQMSFAPTDILEDSKCNFSGGLSIPADAAPVADSVQKRREACRDKGAFISVILGLPRQGGPHFPARGIAEQATGLQRGYWTTRVVEITDNSHFVYDVVAVREGNSWRVVEKRELEGIWS